MTRNVQKRRLYIAGSILLLAIIAIAWWWVKNSLRLHLAATINTPATEIIETQAGFLLSDGPSQFSLYDWSDGHLRWRVHPTSPISNPGAYQWCHYNSTNYCSNCSVYTISANGRYFAAASILLHTVIVGTWQTGTHSPAVGYGIIS